MVPKFNPTIMKFKDEAHKSRIASTRNILAERET